MNELLRSCSSLFMEIFDTSCGVDLFRLLAIFLLFRSALAVLLLVVRGARRL